MKRISFIAALAFILLISRSVAFAWSNPTANPAAGAGVIYIESGTPANSFYIKSNGNVGIGTTNPSAKFYVVGDMRVDGQINIRPAGGATPAYAPFFRVADATNFNTEIFGSMAGGNDLFHVRGTGSADAGVLEIATGDNGNEPIVFRQYTSGAGVERMRIHSNGNVGIGTSSPTTKLEVDGAIKATSFEGGLSGTVSAANVSAGNFGANTGGGNYTFPANVTADAIYLSGAACCGVGISMNNENLTAVNHIIIADSGPNEGLAWADASWVIDNSPLDRSNAVGNLNLYGTSSNIALWRPTLWVFNSTNYATATAQSNGGLNFTTTGSGPITFAPMVGVGTLSPNAFYNTNATHYIAGIDGDDKWVTIQGGFGTPSILNLENTLNTDGGTIGGILWTRTTGQSDAHRNVAGIVGVQKGTGITAGSEIQFWTKAGSGPTQKMVITNAGDVGIGVSSPTVKLDVNGTVKATAFEGGLSGTVSAANVSAGNFGANTGGGNYIFPAGVNAAGPVNVSGLIADRIVATDINKNLVSTISTANLQLSVSSATGTAGSLVFSSSPTLSTPVIANIRGGTAASSTLTLRSTSGAGTSDAVIFQTGSSQERMRIDTTGKVGIGVTPQYQLHVGSFGALTARFGNADTDTVEIGAGNGKLNVGTIDPLYTIGGERYATFVAAMTGVKEETAGVVSLRREENRYAAKLDVKSAEKGSDLWLLYQTTDFGDNWNNLAVLLTANFSGSVWYEKDPVKKVIYIYGEPSKGFSSGKMEVSYRLTAPRFDHEKWSNISDEPSEGFKLDIKE